MKSSFIKAFVSLIVIISSISCETKRLKSTYITPSSLVIERDSNMYFEVVDGTYAFSESGKFIYGRHNPKRYGHSAKIKIKRTNTEFDFYKDSVNHKEPHRMCLFFELVDIEDNVLKDFNVYYSSSVMDFKKLLNAECGSIMDVEFECYFTEDKKFLRDLPEGEIRFRTSSPGTRLIENK